MFNFESFGCNHNNVMMDDKTLEQLFEFIMFMLKKE